MARITEAHAGEYAAIKALCYRGLDSIALRERAGERLMRHLGVPSFCFGECDPASGLPVQSVTIGLAPDAMEKFLRLMLSTPGLDFGAWSGRAQRVARLEEIVDDVDDDPYMKQVLRPVGLRYDVQVACVGDGRSWGHLCLRRRAEDGPFAGHEIRFLAALVPHLTAGLRAAAARAALAAVPGLQTGVIVLGPGGEVELANGVAERLFVRPKQGMRHSYLTAVNIVAGMLERALGDDPAAAVPMMNVIDEANGEVYRLRAERIVGGDGRPRGLVLIEPASLTGTTPTLDALRQFGLTPREAEVALAVLRGQTSLEIAAELAISAHTVHDYLRKVFDKLDVSSRQQLVMRLVNVA